MATKTTGLHRRPTYHELIEEIQKDEKIKLPNRDAIFFTQLALHVVPRRTGHSRDAKPTG